MESFNDWLDRNDEGLFTPRKAEKKPTLPSRLAYHIASAINDAMRSVGKMPPQGMHIAPGTAMDPELGKMYDVTMKERLKKKYYDIAKNLFYHGDMSYIKTYFGFDIGPDEYSSKGEFGGVAVGQGRFLNDLLQDVERQLGTAKTPISVAAVG